MNRIRTFLFTALLALALVGCGAGKSAQTPASPPEAPLAEPAEQADTPAQTPAEKPAEEIDYPTVYAPVLNETCALLRDGRREELEYRYSSAGVTELTTWMERAERLQTVGYALEDVSGDGVPELLIGALSVTDSDVPEKSVIFGGYTCKDGEPICFLEGWGRSSYQWMGGARFYYFGSGGAAYSAFGVYRVGPDGTELTCEDFYFSDLAGADKEEDISYFHNTTGVWDISAAEKTDLSGDAFWRLSEQYEAECRVPELTPFIDYPLAGACDVYAQYLDDTLLSLSDCEDASAYVSTDGKFETEVVFRADRDVRDFRLLALTLRDVDENGRADFDAAEIFSLPVLRADKPLAVPMSFPGDIPSSGFSYTDTNGATRTFTLSVSGMDGSLVIAPLD